MNPFKDKVVLITGGSSGIGKAVGFRLAEYGARLSLASRKKELLDEAVSEIEEHGGSGLAIATDVTDKEQCRHAVEVTVDRFGKLDILICSAGLSMRGLFEESDLAAMEQIFHINYYGTLYCTHYALPHLKQTKGSMVAVSSMTGKRGVPAYTAYGSSKFAVQGLYEALHLELKRDGVHVGVVSPAYVETPILNKVWRADGKPWNKPPSIPYEVQPVEKCVDAVLRCLIKRRREEFLPRSNRFLLALDKLFGGWFGDWMVRKKFPVDAYRIESDEQE